MCAQEIKEMGDIYIMNFGINNKSSLMFDGVMQITVDNNRYHFFRSRNLIAEIHVSFFNNDIVSILDNMKVDNISELW